MDHVTASLLDRAIYSYADVDRLVGLRNGTARRWLDGYSRAGRRYEPVLREESSGRDIVTWGEMVEARLLAGFRDRDVPVQRLRPAIVRLREEFGRYPLALAAPFLSTEGRELVRRVQDEVGVERPLQFVVIRNGQTMLAQATQRFNDDAEYDNGAVARLRPDSRVGEVLMDPSRAFGQPAVRAVRTDALAEDFRAGTSRDELVRLYDLTPQQIDDAIRFELIAGQRLAA